MPQITARLRPDNLPGNAQWSLLVVYLRLDRTDADIIHASLAASSTWNITSELAGDILGGKATLAVDYDQIGHQVLHFYIRTHNPTMNSVLGYPAVTEGLWFMESLVRHESKSHCQSTAYQFNPEGWSGGTEGPGWEDWVNCPNRSPDFGWGPTQLTNPRPNRRELWDWAVTNGSFNYVERISEQYTQCHQ